MNASILTQRKQICCYQLTEICDMDGELHTSVPEDLKRLVRMVVRGFYSMEYAVVIDMLVRHPCVKEDDLAELLKYEKKHLRFVMRLILNYFMNIYINEVFFRFYCSDVIKRVTSS